MRFFDFGDAQWAHVLEVLAVPYGYSTRVTHHPWPALLDAYARVWSDLIDRDELEALMVPAMVTHAVNRSFTWLGAIEGAQPDGAGRMGRLGALLPAAHPRAVPSRGSRERAVTRR